MGCDFERALHAGGQCCFERCGEKGFTSEVIAGMGYGGNGGPLREQVNDKLRCATYAGKAPEAKAEQRLAWVKRKAKSVKNNNLRDSRTEEEVNRTRSARRGSRRPSRPRRPRQGDRAGQAGQAG